MISQQSVSYQILNQLINTSRVRYAQIRVASDVAVLPSALAMVVHDRSDRKFVAVALAFACPPPIVNAKDSDWQGWMHTLRNHGVRVVQLC